jgi:hypothetical protein
MQSFQKYVVVLILVVTFTACQSSPVIELQVERPVPTAVAIPPSPLNGLWQTEGYGQLYEIEGDQFQIYALTAVSCVPTLSGAHLAASEAPIHNNELEAWLEIHILQDDGVDTIGIQVLPGVSVDEKQFVVDGIASQLTLHRLADWPEICRESTANTPLTTFDAFWQTYAEHYPFFEMKGVDWTAVRQQYRPQITDAISDEQLLAIFRDMIAPLEDAHTWIQPIDLDDGFEGQRPDPHPLSKADWQRTAEIVETAYLQTPITAYVKGEVAFGLLAGDIGYLRINGFADYANDDDFWTGMAELETALDDIFSQSFNGLVIDIRANDGGSDLYGLAVASRLTQTPYHAYTIEARSNPTDPTQWTAGQPILVQSSLRPGYDGPVILLTSRYSVSAAETFTMALMGRTPEVRRLGENTQGVFSVVLVHILPNGWWFGLQNERFLTGDGLTFDGAGIPPHINVSIFPPSDLAAGQDSALATAVQLLNQ